MSEKTLFEHGRISQCITAEQLAESEQEPRTYLIRNDGNITYGNLGNGVSVFHDESWRQDRIRINGKHALNANGEDSVGLTFEQFLELLKWGDKHRKTIEKLAKEAEREH